MKKKVTIRYQQIGDAKRFWEILNSPNFTYFPAKPKSIEEEKKNAQSESKGHTKSASTATADPHTKLLKEFHSLKRQLKKEDIYIFECSNCSLFLMLHQRSCPHCNVNNLYFDKSLQVHP